VLALLAPGQGSQTPGFLAPWLDLPGVADRVRWHGTVAGRDLLTAGADPDFPDVVDTAVAQPLIVAAGLATAPLLGDLPMGTPVAGHSVGEFTAAVLAGALDPSAGLALVGERGRAMAEASARTDGGMTAILGGDADEVERAVSAAGCVVANHNGAGQAVAAGPRAALERLAAAPPAGARLRPLSVAGAFHTELMAAAQRVLADVAAGVSAKDPRLPFVSNADGAVVDRGSELVARLVAQVSRPVRWDSCMQTLGAMGVTAVIELPPAGTLTGLVRRALPGVRTVALRGPDDLDEARALIAEFAHVDVSPLLPWRVLVAPVGGTFRAEPVVPGDKLPEGTEVGRVVSHRDETAVRTAHGGVLVEWLAQDGDPVAPGQALARLHPETADVVA
jgi:[acyl-carrier-protein] S-malonyltransferase